MPAKRNELLAYAVQQREEPPLLGALSTLSDDKEYESLDEVVEELVDAQPARDGAPPYEPQAESGPPPGGDAYTK